MIPVTPAAEPAGFDNLVRGPGTKFLESCGTKRPVFRNHRYWGRISQELRAKYAAICAYSCHWIPPDTGFSTVEHFRPKETHPELAYEWSNYRLVCGVLNGRKGTKTDVLDPFSVRYGWFVLEFPSLLIRPGTGLSATVIRRVERTIARLRLNDETSIQARYGYVMSFRNGDISLNFLRSHAPFIAHEIERKGQIATVGTLE